MEDNIWIEEEVADDIYIENEEYIISPKKNGALLLGNYFIDCHNYQILELAIPASAFFKHSIQDLYLFMKWYGYQSWDIHNIPPYNILKLHMTEDGSHRVVIKTFWLRWIQRAWKARIAARTKARGSPAAQAEFSLRGRWCGAAASRGLVGLLVPAPAPAA